jgi:hypothetical protein
MAFSSSAIQPVAQPKPDQPVDNTAANASLLSMLVLSVYAAQKSKKSLRKLKRKLMWTALKLKVKSLFSRKSTTSDRQLILYILLGILALVLVFYYPIAALIVAIVGLILYLTGTI